jgi:hypothetical protein
MIRDLQNLSTDVNNARLGFFDTYKFGYLGEVNSNSTDYPLILLLPPTSNFADVHSGYETMTLEFHCYQPLIKEVNEDTGQIIKPQNATTSLENTFDALLHQFRGTVNVLVRNNENKYVLQDGWNISRLSHEFNDDLVSITATITINKLTDCLANQSYY